MEHNLGPWRVRKGDLHLTIENQDGAPIAIPHSGPYVSAPGNARLIAAAPDLLAALEGLIYLESHIGGPARAYVHHARAAIAKARDQ